MRTAVKSASASKYQPQTSRITSIAKLSPAASNLILYVLGKVGWHTTSNLQSPYRHTSFSSVLVGRRLLGSRVDTRICCWSLRRYQRHRVRQIPWWVLNTLPQSESRSVRIFIRKHLLERKVFHSQSEENYTDVSEHWQPLGWVAA